MTPLDNGTLYCYAVSYILTVIYVKCRIFYRYAKCRYAEYQYAECRYAECRYADFHYADCHGDLLSALDLQASSKMV